MARRRGFCRTADGLIPFDFEVRRAAAGTSRERRTRLPEPWRRVDGGRGKMGARYIGPAGYVIENCGHPTALWPYALIAPDGRLLVGRNGYAFRNLELAAAEVARIQRGGEPRYA